MGTEKWLSSQCENVESRRVLYSFKKYRREERGRKVLKWGLLDQGSSVCSFRGKQEWAEGKDEGERFLRSREGPAHTVTVI